MTIKLYEKRTMNRRFIRVNDLEVSHSSKKRRAGKHEVTPGCLQAGRSNAGGLVGGLAKSVGHSAKIREAIFPKKLRDSRNIRGVSVEVPCNEYGALKVHTYLQ